MTHDERDPFESQTPAGPSGGPSTQAADAAVGDPVIDPDAVDVAAFDAAVLRARGALPPPATCPIGWQPSALTPVFYGARDLGPSDGAPVRLRIFFPSLDGAVFSAPILAGCGRYPLIVLAHGHCPGDSANYQKWFLLPAQLARAGYVVVVPELAGTAGGIHPSVPDHPDLPRLSAVIQWARQTWEDRGVLLPAPATGIIGHSYGALVAARFAATGGIAAYAGLSGVWQDWPSGPPPIVGVTGPTLLAWGGPLDLFTQLSDAAWNQLRKPRHRLVFSEGLHWDYLPTRAVPCSSDHGPCSLQGAGAADVATMFFGKYLPPELATDLPGRIPNTLIPPALVLTPDQEFFAGSYLFGLRGMSGTPGCGFSLDHATPDERIVPFVIGSPRALAAADVVAENLVPRFTGSGTWVSAQSPHGGKIVTAGSVVTMRLRSGPIP